jgi:hypothetical protein
VLQAAPSKFQAAASGAGTLGCATAARGTFGRYEHKNELQVGSWLDRQGDIASYTKRSRDEIVGMASVSALDDLRK